MLYVDSASLKLKYVPVTKVSAYHIFSKSGKSGDRLVLC